MSQPTLAFSPFSVIFWTTIFKHFVKSVWSWSGVGTISAPWKQNKTWTTVTRHSVVLWLRKTCLIFSCSLHQKTTGKTDFVLHVPFPCRIEATQERLNQSLRRWYLESVSCRGRSFGCACVARSLLRPPPPSRTLERNAWSQLNTAMKENICVSASMRHPALSLCWNWGKICGQKKNVLC